MKKILAIVLALSLALSLSVVAFANGSPSVSPELPPPSINPGGGVNTGSSTVSKYSWSATDSNGAPVLVDVAYVDASAFADELDPSTVVQIYSLKVVTGNGPITFNVYAPGASNSDTVIVRDAWEVVPGANLKVSGDRATFTVDADVVNTYSYVAIVTSFDDVEIVNPSEPGDTDTDDTDIDVGDTDTQAPAKDNNPKTGVALAVVPMIVAAAAVVVSKRR